MKPPIQKILFGSPGTGKSYKIRSIAQEQLGIYFNEQDQVLQNSVKTVFHPEYTYADFMGKLLPLTQGGNVIYKYYPGHFLKILGMAYRSAIEESNKNFLLVIDELNRGNAAAIFGTVFQLLDRNDDFWSTYEIDISEMELIGLLESMGYKSSIEAGGKIRVNHDKKLIELDDFCDELMIQEDNLTVNRVTTLLRERKIQLPDNLTNIQNSETSSLSIAYIGQPHSYHTINELKKIYLKKGLFYVINRPLPINYCSYWNVEDIDIEKITEMHYFNHIFYLSFKKAIFSYKDFNSIEDIVLSVCNNKDKNISYDKLDVFRDSIFRGRTFDRIADEFSLFIKSLFDFCKIYLNLIDIKYLPESYFLDFRNVEDIKSRSVRKQFFYEYLVEKAIKNSPDEISKLNILSDFWLPSCGQTTLIENGQPFMNGYIRLKNIDFIDLTQNYCSQDFSSIQNQLQTRQTAPQSSYQLQTTKTTTWSVNDRVKHINFGMGKVTHILGSGQRINLAVKFDSCGQKIIDPRIAPMVKLEN